MLALTYLSAIRFSGEDAGEFLHSQLSADIKGLDNGQSTFACYCEPKGRVLALMLVCKINQDYYVLLSASLAVAVIDRLKIYVMRSKVLIEILNEKTVSGLMADEAPELTSSSMPAIPVPISKRWLVLTDRELTPANDTASESAWKACELKIGVVWLNPETSGQFLPQMLGYDNIGAVNFKKGCYPGQEIVARTHYLGKVKRHPRALTTASKFCPAPLDKIQIFSGDKPYNAVIADFACSESDGTCLYVVTRMDPELNAEKMEYQDQSSELLKV
jgi:folate-binding protein YgfZ